MSMQMLNGEYGTNPYSTKRYFEDRGYKVDSLDGDDILNKDIPDADVYVLSFWNSPKISKALHTVAVRKTGKGIEIFNLQNGFTDSTAEPSIKEFFKTSNNQPVLLIGISNES